MPAPRKTTRNGNGSPVSPRHGHSARPPNGSSPGSGIDGVSRSDRRIRAAASALVSRSLLASAYGLTFDGLRDLPRSLGYKPTLVHQDYRARYDRNGIADRIIEAYPKATWSGGFSIVEDEDPTTLTPFESAFTSLYDRLNLPSIYHRADKLMALGRYSVILIGAAGAKGPADLSTELPRLTSPDQILYLQPIGEDKAQILKWVTDPTSPRFNRPLTYQLNLSPDRPAGVSTTFPTSFQSPIGSGVSVGAVAEVHWSRIIHLAEGTLEDEIWGKPRLRNVWDFLDDLDKVRGGGAEAAWVRVNPGLHADADIPPNVMVTPEQMNAALAEVADQVEEYQHGMRRTLFTRNVKLNELTATVTNFGPNAIVLVQFIAGSLGIPYRVLFGSEMGELASSQDEDNWDDQVGDRMKNWAAPTAVRQLVDRLLIYGALPLPRNTTINRDLGTVVVKPGSDGGYEVEWPTEDELNESEKGTLISALALANMNQDKAEGKVILTSDEIRDRVYGMDPLPDPEPPPEPPPVPPVVVAAPGDPANPNTATDPAADSSQPPPPPS